MQEWRLIFFFYFLLADADTALAFLNKLIDVVKHDAEAKILLQCAVGSLHLQRKEMKIVKELLEETKDSLDSLTGVDSVVNSSYYILSARFHKVWSVIWGFLEFY